MTEILKAILQLQAEAKNFKKTSDDARELLGNVKRLGREFDENAESVKELQRTLTTLGGESEETAQEYKILRNDLERTEATMKRQIDAIRETTQQLNKLESASEEEAQAARQILDAAEKVDIALEGENAALRKVDDALDDATEGAKRNRIEQQYLSNAMEETAIETKALYSATLQQETAFERAKITTAQLRTEAGRLKQEEIAGAEAARRHLIARKLLNLEFNDAEQDVLAMRAAMFQLRVEEHKLANQTTFLGVSVDDLKQSLITAVAAGGVAGLVFKGMELITDGFRRMKDAAVEFQRQSTATFSELQEEIARTRAQVPELVASQEQLYVATRRIARDVGRAPVETATALRKAQNLGLDYLDSVAAIEKATLAAKVANADMTETVVTAMSTVNAYGRGVYDVGQVLDQYAYLTQNSNLETQDLISGMAKIISPAAEAGVSLEEVVAAMIIMNRQGDDFQEIGDLLGNTLTQIAVRGTQLSNAFVAASGTGFREFTASGGTLIEGLKLIEEHARDTGQSVSELAQGNSKFYRDMLAGRGILELTGRHMKDLEEAFAGTAKAQGTLNKQAAEFEGTLYEANLQLEAARENAWAAEGSLTQGLAVGWAQVKTQFYDLVAGISEGKEATDQLIDSIAKLNSVGGSPLSLAQIRSESIAPIVSQIEDGVEQLRVYDDLQKQAAIILLENSDITAEELKTQLELFYTKQQQLETEKEITNEREQIFRFNDKIQAQEGRRLQQAAENSLSKQVETEELRKQLELEEALAANAPHREALEKEIAAAIKEQRQQLDAAYGTSQNFATQLTNLQIALSEAKTTKDKEDIGADLAQVGEDIQRSYLQAIVDARLENEGFNNSIVDLAIRLGLVSEEAGQMQKDFVRINTELDKLSKMKYFDDLSIEQQAIAAERLAQGLALSAEEAFDFVSTARWRETEPRGIVRAEEAWGNVEPDIVVDQEQITQLDEIRENLETLTAEPWETDVAFDGAALSAMYIAGQELDQFLNNLARERTAVIKLRYEGGGVPPELQYATGGSFTVPSGYMEDNFLIGLSSGERVTVTPANDPGGGGGESINISLVQHFSGGAHNANAIGAHTRDALYEALEKAGLAT